MIGNKLWQKANQGEEAWWGNCMDTSDEEAKQQTYASLMGLDEYRMGTAWVGYAPFDMQGKSVLDIGGGPVSLLLKCRNLGKGVVLDPAVWPKWALARYKAAGIGYRQEMAEGAVLDQVFDEVWIYNVLQHVQNPEQVVATALKYGRLVRVFEWINTTVNATHPHSLTKEFLNACLGTRGTVHNIEWERYAPHAYSAVVDHCDHAFTVTITSCGRFDLLERTVESLLATIDRWPDRIIISDDSGKAEQHQLIREAYGNRFEVYTHAENHGQAWNLDFVYGLVKTPYLFHCEDDWEFSEPGYIGKSLDILESCPEIAVVGLARNKEFERLGAVGQRHETQFGTVYYDHPRWRIDENHLWWHGWIGSPNLKRKVDYLELGKFSDYETEYGYDQRFGDSGRQSVWLENQYVKHTGGGRSMCKYHSNPLNWGGPAVSKCTESQTPGLFRFHLLGLAHVPTHPEVSPCAYTQKVVKLARMLKALGHHVTFYGGEGSNVECDEFVQVISDVDRIACYGDYDWRTEFFKHSGTDLAHMTFNENAIREINVRKQAHDFLLCPMGNYDQSIADAVGLAAVESGIGYRGVFAKYRIFESYTWMMYVYGLLRQNDGSWYDAVIPNCFDPKDFPYQSEKDDYFLYIGRLVRRKGLDVAVQVTRALEAKLVIAGQGTLVNPVEGLNITDDHVEHIGSVGPEERKALMGKARAVFVPTYYIEPFGGVAVEAMMCGTPVITTDWGVFSETVLHNVTGYRCRTFDDFVWAARNIDKINPATCHEWATKNYSMDRVGRMYNEYFRKVYDIWDKGWYQEHPDREGLEWLVRYYPENI